LNDKLEQTKSEYLDKLKRVKLLEAGVDYSDVETYTKYLQSDDEEGIEQEAQAIVADIKQQSTVQDNYIDERVWRVF